MCLHSGTGIWSRRQPLLLRESRRALGRRGIPGAFEMRGTAQFAGQVLVENRRTAAGAESTETSGWRRPSHHQGEPNPRQWQLRLRRHPRGN